MADNNHRRIIWRTFIGRWADVRSLLLLLLTVILAGVSVSTMADNDKWVQPERSVIEQTPNAMPFYPSRASTQGRALTPEMFDSAETCRGCHQQIYQQWQGSAMAQAWVDPIYQALLQRASAATDAKVDNFCIGCHSPIGMTAHNITTADLTKSFTPPGVSCEVCHNISAVSGNDNGAYVLTPSENGKRVKYGPHRDAASPYHQSNYSELLTKSEFCAVCHNVSHPFNSTPIERTYDEWSESAYNEQGVQCQDCHMTPGPGVTTNPGKSAPMGKQRDHIASHHFTGGNVTLHKHFGQHEMAERAREMLRSAATIEVLTPEQTLLGGELATIKVKVSNVGAGHKIPTGFPEGREMWVDFKVTDSSGNLIYRSGAIRNGKTETGTRNFKVYLGDKDNNVVDLDVWSVDRVLADTRILPKGYAIVDYTFTIPTGIQGPLVLNAELNYWPFSQHLVDELLGPGKLAVEVVQMTSVTQSLAVQLQLAQK
ncbi:multiheme c-type cytochrome [Thalassotalea sp. ND16A]|uniref:multiheme c-type cytochrome n=1 Tax=Thalassotalea sp. ND16A TaxID=1535422 RepID=UPI00051CC9AB|nr:multiheme c-type cytochrome [Thalassotalea sp. ND16A]KGJ99315.1 hypothetical protein ND16A_3836 [Thalassotalea sp. ND16A]